MSSVGGDCDGSGDVNASAPIEDGIAEVDIGDEEERRGGGVAGEVEGLKIGRGEGEGSTSLNAGSLKGLSRGHNDGVSHEGARDRADKLRRRLGRDSH